MIKRIERVKNRDMRDGHGATGPARPELLAENARITRRNRRMIQTGRVYCDFVPTMNGFGARWRVGRRRHVSTGTESFPESVAEGRILDLDGGRQGGKREQNDE